MFSKNFDQYIYLNLDQHSDKSFFEYDVDFDTVLATIFFNKNLSRDPNKRTLIFIDEIQNSHQAIAMMRYFYEQANDLFVIGAGSLLETLITKKISFPVGRVEYLFMQPLSFVEFLNAIHETKSIELINTIPIPEYAHSKLLNLFHQYTLIGGMPEVVQHYARNKDIVPLNELYQNLMISYKDDVEKYARSKKSTAIIRHVISQAPFETGKRIKFHGFGHSNYGSTEIFEALSALEKTMILKLVYQTSSVKPPVIPQRKKSPKLQFLDTGLINYISGLQKYYFTMKDLNSFYLGIIAEHIVGQELIAADIFPSLQLHFWAREKKQSSAEVDFIVPFDKHIIPIEVKAGKSGTLRSLHQFMDATDHSFAIRLYSGKMNIETATTTKGKTFTLLNLPYYLTSQIISYIDAYMKVTITD